VPSYFYDCRECCKVFTVKKPIAEIDQPGICPVCGVAAIKRVIMGPFFARKSGRIPRPSGSPTSNDTATPTGMPPTVTMVNCVANHCKGGVHVGGNARVVSYGLKLNGTQIGVEVDGDGEFYDFNTDIR
jgi:putative FmdB family regulatory protein